MPEISNPKKKKELFFEHLYKRSSIKESIIKDDTDYGYNGVPHTFFPPYVYKKINKNDSISPFLYLVNLRRSSDRHIHWDLTPTESEVTCFLTYQQLRLLGQELWSLRKNANFHQDMCQSLRKSMFIILSFIIIKCII